MLDANTFRFIGEGVDGFLVQNPSATFKILTSSGFRDLKKDSNGKWVYDNTDTYMDGILKDTNFVEAKI